MKRTLFIVLLVLSLAVPLQARDSIPKYGDADIANSPVSQHTIPVYQPMEVVKTGSLTQAQISTSNSYAGIYLAYSLDLSLYPGGQIVLLDSSSKKHIGYLKAIGTEKGVSMTAVGAGSSGITVADDDDLDMGTNNFSVFKKAAIPDYTPAGNIILEQKHDGSNGWIFYVLTTGKLRLTINGTNYDSTAAITATDGTEHEFGALVTRESASVAGKVQFTQNGVQIGTDVAITAGAPATVSNAVALYSLGTSAARTAGVDKKKVLYNRALTVAESLTRYSAGVAEADQYGSQTAKSSDTDWTGASGATPPTGWTIPGGQAGVHTIFDSGDGAPFDKCLKLEVNATPTINPNIYKTYTVEIGKKYRVSWYFKHGTGTCGRVIIGSTVAGAEYSGSTYNTLTDAAWTKYTFEFTATTTVLSIRLFTTSGTTGQYELFDEVFVYQIGATLDLNESGIDDASWADSSTNGNDASYPASGSAIVRLDTITSVPHGSVYNWYYPESGFNTSDSSGYTYSILLPSKDILRKY